MIPAISSQRRPAWFDLPAPFVFGWREVFIPLAVVVHDQHGPVLAMAGLAVAAARVGGWFVTRSSAARRVRTSALLAALALLLLGLTPEEGPAGLLLWLVFGIAWSLVEVALAAHDLSRWLVSVALLAGMALAGPLAAGPGAWLVAVLCLLIAWRAGPGLEAAPDREAADHWVDAGSAARRLSFLFSASYLAWFWLMPARLLQEETALVWIGALAATHWLARLLVANLVAARLPGDHPSGWQAGAALGLAAILAAVWFVPNTVAATMAVLIASGAMLGVVASDGSIARPESGQRPSESQALGEMLAPAAGALLVLVIGQPAAFAAAALAATAMTVVILRGAR